MRVCLDTNVLVAAFATRGLCAEVLSIVLEDHELVIGEVILEELDRTLGTKFGVPADRIAMAKATLATGNPAPRPTEPHPLELADPDDGWVLATAVAGHADVLVTGDQDLLSAADRAPLAVLSPRGFWERLRKGT